MKNYNCLNSQMIEYIDNPKKSAKYLPAPISLARLQYTRSKHKDQLYFYILATINLKEIKNYIIYNSTKIRNA